MHRLLLLASLLVLPGFPACARLAPPPQGAQRHAIVHVCTGYRGLPVFLVEERRVARSPGLRLRYHRTHLAAEPGHRIARQAAHREGRAITRDRGNRYGESRNSNPRTRQRTRD